MNRMMQMFQCPGNAKTTFLRHYLKDARGKKNESQCTCPWCWMTRVAFIKVSDESEHRVSEMHKGKAWYRGRLFRHSWIGRHGELTFLNHVVERVWKELSDRGANVINVPFKVTRTNFCMGFYLRGVRWGGVEALLSKLAQDPCRESAH